MTISMIQPTNTLLNTIVYVDYENISELLQRGLKDPLKMEFFRVIRVKLQESGLKIVDFIVYGNFEKDSQSQRLQSLLRGMGFQARQASVNPKNSGDLEITVDALRTLYKNPNISVFVIISSGRDFIPLLKTIKFENKISYVFSTRNGFNQVMAEYADFHEYLEDIFHLTGPEPQNNPLATDLTNPEQIERAKEVCRYFYNSHIWRRSLRQNEPVNLHGYIQVISRIINRSAAEILDDFKRAHLLKYVTIYQDPSRRQLFIKQGEKTLD
ncbi:MAG: NYN domain-containing protein [Firmicutes bacterium]|nr:NYN domain-containing protein [Bacillota bacterium]